MTIFPKSTRKVQNDMLQRRPGRAQGPFVRSTRTVAGKAAAKLNELKKKIKSKPAKRWPKLTGTETARSKWAVKILPYLPEGDPQMPNARRNLKTPVPAFFGRVRAFSAGYWPKMPSMYPIIPTIATY